MGEICDERESRPDGSKFSVLFGGRDSFLSGWGCAKRNSWVFWACRPEDADAVEEWVEARTDLSQVSRRVWLPREADPGDHWQIYVVDAGHPALEQKVGA